MKHHLLLLKYDSYPQLTLGMLLRKPRVWKNDPLNWNSSYKCLANESQSYCWLWIKVWKGGSILLTNQISIAPHWSLGWFKGTINSHLPMGLFDCLVSLYDTSMQLYFMTMVLVVNMGRSLRVALVHEYQISSKICLSKLIGWYIYKLISYCPADGCRVICLTTRCQSLCVLKADILILMVHLMNESKDSTKWLLSPAIHDKQLRI